jgi:signal transduction histidine kinase
MKIKGFILGIALCVLNGGFIYSQTREIDSLKLSLIAANEDTNKVNTLYELVSQIRESNDLIEALKYGNEALQLSTQLKYKKGLAGALGNLGVIYEMQGDYNEGIRKHKAALKIRQEINDMEGIAKSYLRLGIAYADKENLSESMKNFYAALKYFETVGYKKGIADTYQMIGATFLNQGNDAEAKENLLASAKIRQETGDLIGLAQSYNSIAFLTAGNLAEKLNYHFSALRIYEQAGIKRPRWGLPWTYACIAGSYNSQADSAGGTGDRLTETAKLSEALKYYFLALENWQKAKDNQGIAEQYINLGNQYIRLKKFSIARLYLEKAFLLSQSISYKKGLKLSSKPLSELHSMDRNYKQALKYYKIYISSRDSIFSEEFKKNAVKSKMQYEFDKKEVSLNQKQILTETKLQVQKKQRYFYWIGIVILGLLSFFVFLNFRNQKRINKLASESHARQKSEMELQSQQAVLSERLRISSELHDEVGATLSGISMYSHLTKEQMKTGQTAEIEKSLNVMQQSSAQMVDKLNDIVWLINPEQDSLQKMIERLEEYTTNMAVVRNMQVRISVPEKIADINLPVENRRNIYLFCKEAINNAVKYSNGTLLNLTVKEADDKLEFSVSDNGKGFDAVMVRRGNGLENMQKRADEIGAKLVVQSKENGGVSVSMQCITLG